MNLKQVTHRLALPSASVESLHERRYWLQCERTYTYQPIYRTDGRLLAVELLTIVTHPGDPSRRIAPDRYFAGLPVRYRVEVIEEQLQVLSSRAPFFTENHILASVNVDGPTLMAMRDMPQIRALTETLPWVRFELVEHISLPQNSTFASFCEFGPLWLDDFGTGMANFSALNEVRYDYIKVARDLFTMLLQLMNHYCEGVIVEGVETLEEWQDVQQSPALAAQGYFLSRPVPFETLETVILRLS